MLNDSHWVVTKLVTTQLKCVAHVSIRELASEIETENLAGKYPQL